jgi:hypothetical protein
MIAHVDPRIRAAGRDKPCPYKYAAVKCSPVALIYKPLEEARAVEIFLSTAAARVL